MNDYSNPTRERLEQRFAALRDRHGYACLADTAAAEAFLRESGATLLLFAEDPLRVPETWDLTVILPEVLKDQAQPVRVGLLPPETARALAGRYGLRVWPALLLLRGGDYLGAIEGLQDWGIYRSRLTELLAAPPSRPPGIGVAVLTDGGSACHH